MAQELLTLPFNHIYYTGGQRVGRLVMKAAAENFAAVTLEMGGKNPAIVDASAAIDNAAKKIAWGRVANAGQVCVAPDYVLVHESVYTPCAPATASRGSVKSSIFAFVSRATRFVSAITSGAGV